jgi:glycine/D-amino acid oxidase-like deaminating enzyme
MHVVVVGAGVFGTWTAHHLHERGARVTLVDAYGPGNSRSSSGDETRIVRCGYGPDAIYSALARRSREQWRALSDRLGHPESLWHQSGVLWMAAGNDSYTTDTRDTLTGLGMPPDVLTAAEVSARFPQFDIEGIEVALLERDGGVVTARRAVRALAADLEQRGVRLVAARVEAPVTSRVAGLRTRDGGEVAGDCYVFACGAWLPSVFHGLLRSRIRPTRQVVAYFGAPAGNDLFTAARMPAWIDFPSGIYGTPDIDGRGVKVGIDEHGGPIDPDTDERIADPWSLARAREWLARRIPALARAPVIESRVCAYENSATGDFLVDRHPSHENVWIVGGGSGHGFKHGPAIGELTSRMILDGERPDARFAIENKGADARRTVY